MEEKRLSQVERRSSGAIGSIGSPAKNAGESEELNIDRRSPNDLGARLLEARKKRPRWKLHTVYDKIIRREDGR
jgi:hypothetical protein